MSARLCLLILAMVIVALPSLQVALQAEVDELRAKVAEASGVLATKAEMKEARQKAKAEIDALKAELKELQMESKSGGQLSWGSQPRRTAARAFIRLACATGIVFGTNNIRALAAAPAWKGGNAAHALHPVTVAVPPSSVK